MLFLVLPGSQPLDETAEEVLHGAGRLASSSRVGEDVTGGFGLGRVADSEGECQGGLWEEQTGCGFETQIDSAVNKPGWGL